MIGVATPYVLHGLRLASEVVLPDVASQPADPAIATHIADTTRDGTDGGTASDGRADVRIELLEYQPVGAEPPPGDLILDHHVNGHRQYAAARTGDHVRFRVPGHADFDVTGDLSRIACTPDPRVAPGYMPIMLTGNVVSFLLTLSGHTVLHAGAVDVDGGAVAVVGPSGVGKSTLTAWLCAVGARLITDDVLRLDRDGICHRGGREIRLRDRARPLAMELAQSGGAVRRTVDGRYAVRPPVSTLARLPLRAVVIPRPLPGSHALAVHRVDALSAAMVLAGVPRTLGWRMSAPAHAHFTTVTEVAANIAVHIVDIPWGPPFDPGTPRRVMDLLGFEPPDSTRTHVGSAVDLRVVERESTTDDVQRLRTGTYRDAVGSYAGGRQHR